MEELCINYAIPLAMADGDRWEHIQTDTDTLGLKVVKHFLPQGVWVSVRARARSEAE